MSLFIPLSGTITLQITSADIISSINEANRKGIRLYKVNFISDLSVFCDIPTWEYNSAKALFLKRGDKIKIIARRDSHNTIKSIFTRKLLMLGITGVLIVLMFLPTKVIFIMAEGNENLSEKEILAAANSCGIRFGASRRDVRSEKVKNELLSRLPELQWAGINTRGCTAIISVKERTAVDVEETHTAVGNIIADREGVITNYTVIQGSPVCSVGDAVSKGQLLISGYIENGICIDATQAMGEVFAETKRKMTVIMPTEFRMKNANGPVKRNISVMIGKKRINLWKGSGISDPTCDRIYREYYVTLPGGYKLPLGVAIDSIASVRLVNGNHAINDIYNHIEEYAQFYLVQNMIAGEICTRETEATTRNGVILFNGEYVCTEMIGRVQRELIGEEHGEIN